MSIVSAVSDFYHAVWASPSERMARYILANFYKAEFGTPKYQKALDDLVALDPRCGFMDLTKISARTEWIKKNFAMDVEDRKTALDEQPNFYWQHVQSKKLGGIAYQVMRDCYDALMQEETCRRLPLGKERFIKKAIEMGRLKDSAHEGAHLPTLAP